MKTHLLENLEGTIFMYLFVVSWLQRMANASVTLAFQIQMIQMME